MHLWKEKKLIKKFTPEKVALMMRNLKHTDDGKFFKTEKEFFRAQKLQAPNTNKKEQCDIHAESNDNEEFDDTDKRMDVVENYLKLEMNDFILFCWLIREKESFY